MSNKQTPPESDVPITPDASGTTQPEGKPLSEMGGKTPEGAGASPQSSSAEPASSPNTSGESSEAMGVGSLVSRMSPYTGLEDHDKMFPGYAYEKKVFSPLPTPLSVFVAPDLALWTKGVDPLGRVVQNQVFAPMRVQFFENTGVHLPAVHVEIDNDRPKGSFAICLFETPVATAYARRDHILVGESTVRLKLLGVDPEETMHPTWHRPASWVHREHSHLFENQLLPTWDCGDYIAMIIAYTMQNHAHEFLGIQETRVLLDQLATEYPALVEEVQRVLPLPKLRRVLRTLVKEKVSLFRLRHILESLLDATTDQELDDIEEMVDVVRQDLRHHLSYTYLQNEQLLVYLLSPQLEAALIQHWGKPIVQDNESLDEKEQRRQLWDNLLNHVGRHLSMIPGTTHLTPVVVVQSHSIRRPLQRLLHIRYPWLDVLSSQELSPLYPINPIATIDL